MTSEPQRLTFLDLVAAGAEGPPGTIALVAERRPPLEYGVLLAFVENVTRQLRAAGIRAGDRVAMVLPPGAESITAFLAVANAATVVPLNPAQPVADLSRQLEQLAVRLLVTPPAVPANIAEAAARRGIPSTAWQPSASSPAGIFSFPTLPDPPPRDSSDGSATLPSAATGSRPDDVGFILETSGSTGRPKRVPHTQAALVASSILTARRLGLGPTDRCLHPLPLTHVHGLVSALLVPLAAGGSIAAIDAFEPDRFLDWLRDLDPTWYTVSPPMHLALLDAVRARVGRLPHGRLRFVRSGSAPMPLHRIGELEAVLGAPFVEAYGMTEVPHISCNPVPDRRTGSVGRSIVHEIAVLAPDGSPAPPGVAGEIAVRGPTVTTGYLDDPDLTRAAFHEGWLRTGDLGHLDTDGFLHLRGRLKEMINRGGDKISPHEVEAALLQHPAVAEAVAFAIPDSEQGEAVAACLVPRPEFDPGPDDTELRAFLRERLAAFKVPRLLLRRPQLRRGPGGKLVRVGLAEWFGLAAPAFAEPRTPRDTPAEPSPRVAGCSRAAGPYAAPELEALLGRIWKETLGVNSVRDDDDFLDLGGDSLVAGRLLSRVSLEVGAKVPLQSLFDHPTFGELVLATTRALTRTERVAAALVALAAEPPSPPPSPPSPPDSRPAAG